MLVMAVAMAATIAELHSPAIDMKGGGHDSTL
jgi:hypothetical protein